MQPRLDYYAASPDALKAMLALEAATFALNLEKSLLELVKVRVSQLNHCAFCADMHAVEARRNGESERRLYALAVWREAPFFSVRERAALAWAEALTQLPGGIDDALYAASREVFSEAELVDLNLAVTTIAGWNRLAVAFRQLPSL